MQGRSAPRADPMETVSIQVAPRAHRASPPARHYWRDSRRHQTRGDEMAWVALVAAGLFETAFAVCLKLSDGLRVFWPTVGFALSALISFGLLMLALRELEVGPAYAVWTGIGAAGAAAAGMLFLGDAASAMKLASIALILAGVIGLNLS
jgi:quaternary ammonium compound-resistance protein SugE